MVQNQVTRDMTFSIFGRADHNSSLYCSLQKMSLDMVMDPNTDKRVLNYSEVFAIDSEGWVTVFREPPVSHLQIFVSVANEVKFD